MRKIVPCTFLGRIAAVYDLLIAVNIAAWVWAWCTFRGNAALLGTAFVAFTLGLRHAADADHIAAIDNVTRKLMQDGHRPLSVGFYFALGHSTVVLIASLAIFLTTTAIETHLSQFKEIGAIFGTLVSALFMVGIALMNLLILIGTYKRFRQARNGGTFPEQNLDLLVAGGGVMTRLFRPVFRMLSRSWHIYPVGFLFGLGFDTATEVALFGISAAAAAKGLSICAMMIFPVLFAAGMVLADTTDGILMVGAYGWAFVKPIRKLYYNMTITFVSVVVAFFVGGVEALGLLKDKLNLSGGFWDLVGNLNDNFGGLGFIIISVFVLTWAGSMIVYRLMRYDQVA
jgi:high-affinity nickel-transport protein